MSRASDRILASRDRVLALWEERVRKEIPNAAREDHAIILNTLPALIRQLAEALSPNHPRRLATEGSTVAEEHGGERVRMTHFSLEDVIHEYMLLREVIVEVLEEDEPLTAAERKVLHSSIDENTMKACTAYVLVQAGFREQFAAVLAHDLRGPLSAAKAAASLVLRKPSAEDVPRWVARVIDSIDRADRMIQDLLDAMRAQTGAQLEVHLEESDLVVVVREAVDHLRTVYGDRFVVVVGEPVQGRFGVDPMRRAVENLAINAVKYGAAGRPITITVNQVQGRALILVHNEGPPIPAEQMPTLFRAFQRLSAAEKSGHRGWGLGLAQVRAVAEAHGGSIAVDSLEGLGTTFTIDVPLRPPERKA
ncbi:MAG: sensor histidine kinase [Myxococcales bacterium]